MNKPIDWTKPIETVGSLPARLLGVLEKQGLYFYVVAVTGRAGEYLSCVSANGCEPGNDGEQVSCVVNKVVKKGGWMNLYLKVTEYTPHSGGEFYTTEAQAIKQHNSSPGNSRYLGAYLIEWTES